MAEKRVIELDIQTNAKSLKAQLKEAQADVQQLSEKFGATSQEAIKAAKRAAELKDAIADAKDLTDSFNPDAKFDSLSRSIGGVLDGFQAFEGALGLVGVESEDLQKTMLKVQSAMALSQGIQGLMEAKDSFKQLGAVAVDALKGIRTGLAATGIGLFLVALGTIVAYWDDIKAAVSGVTAEQEKLNKVSKAKFETSKAELENLDAQDNILKLQGKSEREILNLKIAKVNTAIELGKLELQNVIKTSKAEEEAAIQNYNLTKRIVDFILDTALFLPKLMLMPIDMAIKGANKVSEALGLGKLIAFDMGKTMEDMQDKFSGFIAGSIFNVKEVKAEGAKTRKELEKELLDLENQKAGFQNTIKDIDKEAAQTAIDTKKSELDALIELEIKKSNTDEKTLKDLLDKRLALEKLKGAELELAQKNNAEKLQAALNEDIAKELAARNEANKNKIAAENEYLDQIAELQEQNRQKMMTEEELEISAVNEKYFALEEAAKNNADELATIEQAKANELNDINLKYQQKKYDADKASADAELALKKRNRDFAIEMTQSALSTISSITELFGKKSEKAAKRAFQVNKAAQLAGAVISTYKSATDAYASQFTPVPDPTSPVRGAIAAGVAIAAGLANVAKIASQKFEGGGSLGGGGGAPAGAGGGGTMQAPNFSVIGSSGVNQLAQLQQQPTRAYVVSGEVTSQQALDRNRVQNATL